MKINNSFSELEQIAQQRISELERNRSEYQRKIDAIAQYALNELELLREKIKNEFAELEKYCDENIITIKDGDIKDE